MPRDRHRPLSPQSSNLARLRGRWGARNSASPSESPKKDLKKGTNAQPNNNTGVSDYSNYEDYSDRPSESHDKDRKEEEQQRNGAELEGEGGQLEGDNSGKCLNDAT